MNNFTQRRGEAQRLSDYRTPVAPPRFAATLRETIFCPIIYSTFNDTFSIIFSVGFFGADTSTMIGIFLSIPCESAKKPTAGTLPSNAELLVERPVNLPTVTSLPLITW